MTKQEKAAAKRSRRAARNPCGEGCHNLGPGGFSDYGHWNASLDAIAFRGSWRRRGSAKAFRVFGPDDQGFVATAASVRAKRERAR